MPLTAGEHPFRVAHVRRFTQMTFNIASEIIHHEFTHPRQFARLPERTIVHDDSVIPVCGQTARLVPQPAVDYLLAYRGHNLMMEPRRDGLLLQAQGEHDFGNADTAVDRALSGAAVARLANLYG